MFLFADAFPSTLASRSLQELVVCSSCANIRRHLLSMVLFRSTGSFQFPRGVPPRSSTTSKNLLCFVSDNPRLIYVICIYSTLRVGVLPRGKFPRGVASPLHQHLLLYSWWQTIPAYGMRVSFLSDAPGPFSASASSFQYSSPAMGYTMSMVDNYFIRVWEGFSVCLGSGLGIGVVIVVQCMVA